MKKISSAVCDNLKLMINSWDVSFILCSFTVAFYHIGVLNRMLASESWILGLLLNIQSLPLLMILLISGIFALGVREGCLLSIHRRFGVMLAKLFLFIIAVTMDYVCHEGGKLSNFLYGLPFLICHIVVVYYLLRILIRGVIPALVALPFIRLFGMEEWTHMALLMVLIWSIVFGAFMGVIFFAIGRSLSIRKRLKKFLQPLSRLIIKIKKEDIYATVYYGDGSVASVVCGAPGEWFLYSKRKIVSKIREVEMDQYEIHRKNVKVAEMFCKEKGHYVILEEGSSKQIAEIYEDGDTYATVYNQDGTTNGVFLSNSEKGSCHKERFC